MTIHEKIYARLSAYTGLTDLVGARIMPVILGENPSLPAVSWDLQTSPVQAQEATVFLSGTLKVYGWAATHDEALAIAAQVLPALDRWTGDVIICVSTSGDSCEAVQVEPDRWNWMSETDFSIAYVA